MGRTRTRKVPRYEISVDDVKANFRNKLRDPEYFTSRILNKKLWPVQSEILKSVRDNPRTAVRSCHGIGKTFTAAMCILWFLYTHPKAIVLSTAPTWRQVEKLIWKEIRSAYREAIIPLGGNLLPKAPELHLIHDEWYAAGLSTNEPDRFQGFHEEHILVVVDEAAGVNVEIFEAIEGILTSSGARLLLIGNPTSIGTPFYNAFTKPGFKTFHISAYDTPNFTSANIKPEDIANDTWQEKALITPYPRLITPAWVADRYKSWGEDSSPYQVRVMGNFPQQGEDTLIPLLWIELAMERWEDMPDSNYVQLGVDVAAYGSDKTVIAVRKGQKITALHVYSQKNTRETAGLVKYVAVENETRKIYVDEIGIGRGVVDSLEEEGFEDVGVNVAEKSSDNERWHNLRAELWCNLRELLNPEGGDPIALPPDDDLLAELASVKYKIDAHGAIQIEAKDDMRKRLGHSPDRSDAVVLAFANLERGGFVSSVGDMYTAKFF